MSSKASFDKTRTEKRFIPKNLYEARIKFYDQDIMHFELDEIDRVYQTYTDTVIAFVLRRKVQGNFGFDESRYYYLISPVFKWDTYWASENRANIIKEQKMRSLGCSIDRDIISKIFENQTREKKAQSALIIPCKELDGYTFRYVILNKLEKYVLKWGSIYEYSYQYGGGNVEKKTYFGIPQHITTIDDPFLPG